MQPLIVKLGGELIESSEGRDGLVPALAGLAATRPLVVVHGGGRAVDAACDRHGIVPRKVDGLRLTDSATLDVVMSVLGGLTNTQLVAALVNGGARAVGLSGVDAGFGRAERVEAYQTRSGDVVDLGLVGDPVEPDMALIQVLVANGFVPVVASLGLSADGQVLNVNADVMACRIAAGLTGADLVIAGATPGVLDGAGKTIDALDLAGIDAAIADGTATAGMIAKLRACRTALAAGVASIRLVDGRQVTGPGSLAQAPGTLLTAGRGLAA